MKLKPYLVVTLTLAAAAANSWAVPPTKTHHPIFQQQKEQRQERLQKAQEVRSEQGRATTVALSMDQKKAKPHSYHFRHKVGRVGQ